jgi:hypothetical protein
MVDKKRKDTPQYTVSISPVLHNKLDQHVYALKRLVKSGCTKNEWIADAIEKKLAREEMKMDIFKEKPICIKIDPLTKKKLDGRVEMIRNMRYSYSKKQWVLDAIHEKLGNEEEIVKNKLKEYLEALN